MSHDQSLDRLFPRSDTFCHRHLGPRDADLGAMLETLGLASMDELIDSCIPAGLRSKDELKLPAPLTESQVLAELRGLAEQNQVLRSYLGMGYHGTITPTVILRNIFENPGWYTQYTPYQAEISQGRLEALLNFQTLVSDLTGMEVASASLLDEATAAAEAMTLCQRVLGRKAAKRTSFFVSADCHPQTIAVIETRAEALGLRIEVGSHADFDIDDNLFGALVQYPDSKGEVRDFADFFAKVHAAGALCVVAADLLSLTLLKAPGEFGADVVIGSSQRFGVPLGYGGPHAAFMAARATYQRQLPGRIIGVSRDASGGRALRMALQTREQHIRREKATSNICTAQVLLAVAASFYAVYHGPDGLTAIARRLRGLTGILAGALSDLGCTVYTKNYFDNLRILPMKDADKVIATALGLGINLRNYGDGTVGVCLDETVGATDLSDIIAAFGGDPQGLDLKVLASKIPDLPGELRRNTSFLKHPVFHRFHSETEILRYMNRLQARDLSLTTAMIPLGSCTMKLNATSQMIPITWPGFSALHPFVPADQAKGYRVLHQRLAAWLSEITGFAATSLQPNAGSQGEYTGLLVIRAYHRAKGQEQRDVCLIPSSAHGTNPASAKMAGMRVVVVGCDDAGNIDLDDLRAKVEQQGEQLSALMVTYPSTHGVYEATIKQICEIVHEGGGQVYLDGANMNALVGLCKPGEFGADVCHLNLHKTFCIPHGGGGPGMGPISVAEHLAPFLPGHPVTGCGGAQAIGAVSAAPYGSPSILPIPYAYIAMMGASGLRKATEVAILNANYIAQRLKDHYPVLYTGENGRVAHECILDLRFLKKRCGVEAADVAKRLMDYGLHAPTLSFPVAGTLMVEPTESESREELDRFCDAMIQIRAEAAAIESGEADWQDNPLKNSPHTAMVVTGDWQRSYSPQQAAFPDTHSRQFKFWPSVSRVDDVFGDRNLLCTCPPVSDYDET